jgi:hypothetical protein
MTERERRDIEYYLPGDPDPELEDGEYYYLQNVSGTERVIRVYPLDIFPMKDGVQYGLYRKKGGRLCWVDTGWGDDRTKGVYRGDLYDNREDCRNQTHMGCSWWESLRRIQKEG